MRDRDRGMLMRAARARTESKVSVGSVPVCYVSVFVVAQRTCVCYRARYFNSIWKCSYVKHLVKCMRCAACVMHNSCSNRGGCDDD